MNEQLLKFKDNIRHQWRGLSRNQQLMVVGIILFILVSITMLIFWASQPEYTTIYTNLSPSEAGEIVAEIESQGIPVDISSDGSSVRVPSAEASRLKVELAHAGIPRSGNINYSTFSENMGLGMTDQQFDVVHRGAVENQIRYLIEEIDGIEKAQVMITMPTERVFVSDDQEAASASVVLTTRPNLNLNQTQIQGLYHLISRSVPNLPVENIVIMDHNWRAYELNAGSDSQSTIETHQTQRQIRRDIERDIQRELHTLLGTVMGMDKVVVSVFANVDFSQEQREESLVEPVDPDTNEGIAISIERIQETFAGEGGEPGGIPGTGSTDIAGYQGANQGQDSEYERMEERINREVNRIHRQIESSPYTIEDLTIHVGVEPPVPDDPDSLTPDTITDIQTMLSSVVSTYLSTPPEEAPEEWIQDKITVLAQDLHGRTDVTEDTSGISPAWLYLIGAIAVFAIGGTVFTLVKRNKSSNAEDEPPLNARPLTQPAVDDYDFEKDNEETARRKRIERLAKNKPEEFAKLLRTWLSDDER
ncbi:flagellar basal-body MS-ring/collar protein FliF [Caldalkalibacillus salinus]|uniref:flagellar basal-body MS-ring/collar protein FliF n=1 Tax=Caldalkalibacillus salinus TaxID=2803787 RepID=UPI001922CF83|nr:flagellar basal-body MS-ring/collar protein FliF [Caldalkalibacillus salinus]